MYEKMLGQWDDYCNNEKNFVILIVNGTMLQQQMLQRTLKEF